MAAAATGAGAAAGAAFPRQASSQLSVACIKQPILQVHQALFGVHLTTRPPAIFPPHCSLVSAEWLRQHHGEVKVLNATW